MRLLLHALLLASVISFAPASPAQNSREPNSKPKSSDSERAPQNQEIDTLKIDTNLVTVPVIASSHTGSYVADLKKEEFKITEDGVPQEIAFFATTSTPFHVVLLIDTSASTEEKLRQIQEAATTFVNQLSVQDKTKVISFDDELRDLNEFTSDKSILRAAIEKTRSGQGTRVYDAITMALDILRPIDERKAIVIFTDGVDWHSQSSTFENTLHDLDETGVIVYPIRFDTRAETERIARQQEAETNGSNLPTSDVIRQPPPGTTPRTFPSDEPFPVPASPRSSLPTSSLPSIIFQRRTNPDPSDPRNEPFPNSGGSMPPRQMPQPGARPNGPQNDSLGALLDSLYFQADSYLKELADRSGGQLYRADTLASLPKVFAAIAAELRTQYLLGYYPTNKSNDAAYRKIQVKTTRKEIALRSRPGYRALR